MSKLINNINSQIKRNNCDQESKDVLKLYNALINNKLNKFYFKGRTEIKNKKCKFEEIV